MLKNHPVAATIPISSLKRSRDFYENVLGLEVAMYLEDGSVAYANGDGTLLALMQRPLDTPPIHTLAAWMVDDIEAEVEALLEHGVTFRQVENENDGIQTDAKGIATMGSTKGAWFTDPDGNWLGIFQL